MGKIFCIIGKSASGKDVVCSMLLEQKKSLKRMMSYTTRPAGKDEIDGTHYRFVNEEFIAEKEREGVLIEKSVRDTEYGPALYATIDDGSITFNNGSYLAIRDPAGAQKIKEYYGAKNVVVIHIVVDDGIRLMRALTREMTQPYPKYADMCNRYLDDERDFANVQCDFVCENVDLFKCVEELKKIIKENRN